MTARIALLVRLLLIAIAGLFFAYIQFSIFALPEIDAYYHTKLALLLGGDRPASLPEFPWLPLTVLDSKHFTDHHYLFHVLLSPFVAWSIPTGAKWGAVTFATAGFAVFVFCLPPHRRTLLLGSACYLAASPAFIYRMSMVRAQSLSLAVLFLLVLALRKQRHMTTLVLGAVYVLLYNAFPLLILLCGAFWLAQIRHLRGTAAEASWVRKNWWKLPVAVAAGLALGILVHPNFPQNITFLYHHLVDKFKPGGYTVKVGNEWYPYGPIPFLQHVAPSICLLACTLGVHLKRRRISDESFALFIFTTVLMLMNLKSRRFVELFPPFAVLAIFTALKDCAAGEVAMLKRTPIFAALLAVALGGAVFSGAETRKQMLTEAPYEKYALSARWLERNSEPLELVVAADWDDFPRLFHFNHHNTYLVGLDPYFLYARNPQLFADWVKFTRGEIPGAPSDFLEYTFSSRFVFVDRQHTKLRKQLESDPRIRKVFNSDDSSVFQIIGPRHNAVDVEPVPGVARESQKQPQ